MSVIVSFVLPRLEARYFAFDLNLSISSAQAYLSAVASGMKALTGIVFSIAFVLLQFNAIVEHLDRIIARSDFDPQDRAAARVEDRQGLGLSHRHEDGET